MDTRNLSRSSLGGSRAPEQAGRATPRTAAVRWAGPLTLLLLTAGVAVASEPVVATFLGGSGDEHNSRSVRDASGNIYLASSTTSADFPTTAGVPGATYFGGAADLYVAKLSPDLTTLLAATFVGGSGDEKYPALAIASDGSLFVAGATTSTDIPVTPGAYQSSKSAEDDVFVVKLSSDLTVVLASTYLGASGTESWGSLAMEVDSRDNPVLGFRSTSSDFPTTAGAYDTTYNDYAPGHGDVVVARLDGSLANLLASTFIGGALWDEARVLHVAADDTVFVGGDTQNSTSYGAHYPTTVGAYSTCSNHAFSREGFVSRLSTDFTTLMASTCIGRYGVHDMIYGITTSSSGAVVVIGRTEATDFPVTPGAYDTTHNGGADAFVAVFDGGLSTLAASTLLGGDATDTPIGVMIDPSGGIQVAGSTSSADFPTTPDAFDATLDGPSDAFLVRLDASLAQLESATLIGGSDDDGAAAPFAIGGRMFIHGWSKSADFPIGPGAYDDSHNGGADGVVFSAGHGEWHVFADDFETGTLVQWSSATP